MENPENMQQGNPPKAGQKKFPWTPVLIGLLLTLLTLPVIGIAFYASGSVRGEEFCPDDFTRREFSYNRLPVLGWTLLGIEYDNLTGELEETLISEDLVTPVNDLSNDASNKTWHLYRDWSVPDSHDCDARFLVDYLTFQKEDAKNGRTSFWVDWNRKFPKSAKVFWPIVADLARHEMYLGIPQVMRLAIAVSEDQPEQLQSNLLAMSGELWQELGTNDFQQQRFNRAAVRLTRAQAIRSDNDIQQLLIEIKPHVADFDRLEKESQQLATELLTEIRSKLAAKPNSTNRSNSGVPVSEPLREEAITAEKPDP